MNKISLISILLIMVLLFGCTPKPEIVQQTVVAFQTVVVKQTVEVPATVVVTRIVEVTPTIPEATNTLEPPINPVATSEAFHAKQTLDAIKGYATTIAEIDTPQGAATTFGDGTWEVGKDIAPGTYTTTVPTDSDNCYWERVRGFSGNMSDIIANNNVNPSVTAIVTISKTDIGFTSNGCGTWTLKK